MRARSLSKLLISMHAALLKRLEGCLRSETVDERGFDVFRHLLIRHISIEEQLLMPALLSTGYRLPEFRNGIRRDHAGIAALCVPRPEREWLDNLRDLLVEHFRLEEQPDGFFALCDEHLSGRFTDLRAAIDRHPLPRLFPFHTGLPLREQLRMVLCATGIVGAE